MKFGTWDKPLLCMVLIRKRLQITVFEFLCKKEVMTIIGLGFLAFFKNIFEVSEAKCGWQKFM